MRAVSEMLHLVLGGRVSCQAVFWLFLAATRRAGGVQVAPLCMRIFRYSMSLHSSEMLLLPRCRIARK